MYSKMDIIQEEIPKSVKLKISERTKAIMLVHYAGMVCDLDEFNKISKKTLLIMKK